MILGTGVDIVEISRIEKSLDSYGRRFLDRLLSDVEKSLCGDRTGRSLAEFTAGRFAAKEAVFKALGTGLRNARWTDVAIERDPLGKPVAVLTGVALSRAESAGFSAIHVSISHCREYAVAQAIVEGRGNGGDEG